MAVDLSQMTEAQKAALREQLNAEAKSCRQENRKAYEDLRHEFMVNVENQLGIIVKSVKQFKDWLGSESNAFTKIMQRYGRPSSTTRRASPSPTATSASPSPATT